MNKTDSAIQELREYLGRICPASDKVDQQLDAVLTLVRQHEHRKTLRTESLRYMVIIRHAREDAIETGRHIERQARQP